MRTISLAPVLRRVGAAALSALIAAGCSKGPEKKLPPPIALVEEGGAVVARVGGVEITADAVRAIMDAQHVDARAACDLAIRDAVFARAAVEDRLDARVTKEVDHALVRGLADKDREAALAEGPIRDDELQPFVETRYLEVARPAAWDTLHVLVQLGPDAPEDDVKRAEGVAAAIREVVVPLAEGIRGTPPSVSMDPVFGRIQGAVKSVDARGFSVLPQPVPPVGADGKTVVPNFAERSDLDPAYVAAAKRLESRGDVSPVVRSGFGWHVIVLLDRLAPRFLPRAELVDLFHDEVIAARAKALLNKELEGLRSANAPTTERNLESLLGLVRVADPLSATEPSLGARAEAPEQPR
ncbi:MAG: peptidylprolyl isomerase [Polyangiaceae bacterium]